MSAPAPELLLRGDLVSSGRRLDDAAVQVEAGRIPWVGPATSWPGRWVAPLPVGAVPWGAGRPEVR